MAGILESLVGGGTGGAWILVNGGALGLRFEKSLIALGLTRGLDTKAVGSELEVLGVAVIGRPGAGGVAVTAGPGAGGAAVTEGPGAGCVAVTGEPGAGGVAGTGGPGVVDVAGTGGPGVASVAVI